VPTFSVGPSFSSGQSVVWNTSRLELAEVISGFRSKFGDGPFVVVKTESHPHLTVKGMRPRTRQAQSVLLMNPESNELVVEGDHQPAWVASALLREF